MPQRKPISGLIMRSPDRDITDFGSVAPRYRCIFRPMTTYATQYQGLRPWEESYINMGERQREHAKYKQKPNTFWLGYHTYLTLVIQATSSR